MKITRKNGFTLVELLVVLAIIGILTGIITANLSNARAKSRDAKRISDLKQIQLALELYADQDANHQYPTTLSAIAPNYIGSVPRDPLTTSVDYSYGYSADRYSYHIGATLETSAQQGDDADRTATAGWTNDFNGTDTAGTKCKGTDPATGSTMYCYDLISQ